MEFKSLDLRNSAIKFAKDDTRVFSGYASVFGGIDAYGDQIVPGAYKDTLENRERPIQLRWNHFGPVIGKWLDIHEDEKGLYVEGELTKGHSVAEDAYALLRHKAVTGLSIGYKIPDGGKEESDGVRYLKKIDLGEISIVEAPADLAAEIGDVKTALDEMKSLKEIEAFLRDAGRFSRSEAGMLVSRIKALSPGDQGGDGSEASAIEGVKTLFQQFKF